jgi:hypothetical protein
LERSYRACAARRPGDAYGQAADGSWQFVEEVERVMGIEARRTVETLPDMPKF